MARRDPKQVLVVGGGGFIGSNVLKKLIVDGFSTRALDLFVPKGLDNETEWIVGSSNDETLFAKAAQGCNVVIYLAGGSLPASGNANMSAEINSHVGGAIKSAEICRDLGVESFIFASSGGAIYGQSMDRPLRESDLTIPLNAYGVSKISVENYLRVISNLYDLRTISLRLSNPYGIGQKANKSQGFIAAAMAAAIQETTLHIWGDGSVVRDFIHIDDVACAFSQACNYSGRERVFNIGSGIGRSLIEVINLVEEISTKTINIEFNHNRIIDVNRNILNITLAQESLDWSPNVSLKEGLFETYEWWKNEFNT